MSINFRNEKAIERYLREFDEVSEAGNDGTAVRIAYGNSKGIRSEACILIIAHLVEISSINEFDDKVLVIRAALFRHRRYKKRSLFQFKRALQAELTRFHRRTYSFTVLAFLNADYPSLTISSVSSLGYQIQLLSWNQLKSRGLDLTKMWQELRYYSLLNTMDIYLSEADFWQESIFVQLFLPALIHVQAKTRTEAVGLAERAFDLFRAALNLVALFGSTSVFGSRYALAVVQASSCYGLFKRDGSFADIFYTSSRPSLARRKTLTDEWVDGASKLILKLWPLTDRKDIRGLIAEVLLRYCYALDTPKQEDTFLTLWRSLELATMPTEFIDMKDIESRIVRILGNKYYYLREIFPVLRDIRNTLVHMGEFPNNNRIRVQLVNFTKLIVELMIHFLFDIMFSIADRPSLEIYYQLSGQNDVDLSRKKKLATWILTSRGGRP